MKKVFFILIAMAVLLLSSAYAQADGDIAGRNGHEERSGKMFHGHEIIGEMMYNMQQMTEVMQKMVEVMQRKTDHDSMRKMSEIVGSMSGHLKGMSETMKHGEASEDELKGLHKNMLEIKKKVDILQLW